MSKKTNIIGEWKKINRGFEQPHAITSPSYKINTHTHMFSFLHLVWSNGKFSVQFCSGMKYWLVFYGNKNSALQFFFSEPFRGRAVAADSVFTKPEQAIEFE